MNLIDKTIRKINSSLSSFEAKKLLPLAEKEFKLMPWGEDWDTNFATGGGSFAELDLYIIQLIIQKKQPRCILELGSGKSTLAMNIFSDRVGYAPKIISMDEYEKWGNLTKSNILENGYAERTEVVISERIKGNFDFFCGTKYRSIPAKEYDFIFIDGPDPEGGVNLDALELVSKSSKQVDILIDGRFRTVCAFEACFPTAKIYKFINNMTFISGISKSDFRANNFSHMHQKFFKYSSILRSIR